MNGVDDAVVANAHLPATGAVTTATTTTAAAAAAATTDDAELMTRCDCNNVVVVPPPTASQSSQSQTGLASAFPIVSITLFPKKRTVYRSFILLSI